jgi:hypothetical protein
MGEPSNSKSICCSLTLKLSTYGKKKYKVINNFFNLMNFTLFSWSPNKKIKIQKYKYK